LNLFLCMTQFVYNVLSQHRDLRKWRNFLLKIIIGTC